MTDRDAVKTIVDLVNGCEEMEKSGVEKYGIKCSKQMVGAFKVLLDMVARKSEKGKWIQIHGLNAYECSKCKKVVCTKDLTSYEYCHGCGRKMLRG